MVQTETSRQGQTEQSQQRSPSHEELKGAPKPDDPSKPRIIDGVKYWWCEVRKKWGKYSPDQCTLKDKKKSSNSNNNNSSNGDNNSSSRSDRNGAMVEANMADYGGRTLTPVPGHLAMLGHHGTGLSLSICWSIPPVVVGTSCADGGALCFITLGPG